MSDGYDDLEGRLRAAMHQEADTVRPEDRLEAIRAEAEGGRRGSRWLWPLATAAAVAAIAVVGWVAFRPGQPVPGPVGVPTVTQSPSATSSPTQAATGTPSQSPTATTTPVTTARRLPVYFLDALPQKTSEWRLVRQFRQLDVALPSNGVAVPRAPVEAALASALQPPDDPNGFVTAFPAGTTVKVTEVAANHVSFVLSGPGKPGLTPAQQRVAVQQLVWTATAAAQRNVPVEIAVAKGGYIFATVPGGVYKREPAETAYTVLAPIWIDSPGPGATVSASSAVTVRGQACVFEAALSWQLSKDAAVIRRGHTMASSGCPTYGSWQVALGQLAAGSYEFTAQAFSAENGSVVAQNVVRFTVP